jgi:hypothetical protein
MFRKVVQAASQATTRAPLSRRGFLGRLGRSAMVTAGALGTVLAFAGRAHARKPYVASCCGRQGTCKRPAQGCLLQNACASGAYGGAFYCIWSCPGYPLPVYSQCK